MGRNTVFREVKMDTINSDLQLLENLSKKISDLIFSNKFKQISELDEQRKKIIRKIEKSQAKEIEIKSRIRHLAEKNFKMIQATEKKLQVLQKNHNKFNKRLKAYSFNK
tara:strand:- start:608 stop:934 length:327 start_codon:yes stop_codon:yes gene_type:complete